MEDITPENLTLEEIEAFRDWLDAQYYITYEKVKKLGLPDNTNIAFDLYNPKKKKRWA